MFDRVIVVDWSANSRPVRGRDSIWIAVADRSSGAIATTNPRTRAEAIDQVATLGCRPGRVLIGVDFSLGYPDGTAHALGLTGVPWRAIWSRLADLVEDHADNSNNRFDVASMLNGRIGLIEGPFWGCPPARRTPTLRSTKPRPSSPSRLGEWRRVEVELRRQGHRPFSSWQLLGAGSVGGQSLLGIPRLVELEARLIGDGRRVDVWPFTTQGREPTADVVIAEVWPSLYPLPDVAGAVRDEVQVIETARRLTVSPVDMSLAAVDDGQRRIVCGEEGWVLGA